MIGTKTAAKALVAAAALALPVGLALPAQATTSSGCTVTPLKPVFAGFNSTGVKLVDYKISVTCSADRSVEITDSRWEQDLSGPDDHLGTTWFDRDFDSAGSVTFYARAALPNTDDLDNDEEVYHRVHFRVSSNGVTSPYTAWQYSAVTTMTV